MDSNHRASWWPSPLATVLVAILVVVGGCSLDKNGRPQSVIPRIGGHSGQVMEPKRCLLRVAIISRSYDDPAISDVAWRVADEQLVRTEERRSWEANGLRIGRIIGELPPELDAIMRETTAPKKIDPVSYFVESGEQTLISVSDPVDQASLILNREGRVYGKDYTAVTGFFRVTARHEGEQGIALRFTPELRHGAMQRSYQALPTPGGLAPQQFHINDGQEEETLRDLGVNLVVEPGQVVIVGCRPEQKRGLGAFMLTHSQAHSDERMQRLILIWASRNLEGMADVTTPKTSDRPQMGKFFKRGRPDPSPTLSPAPTLDGAASPAAVPESPKQPSVTPIAPPAPNPKPTAPAPANPGPGPPQP